MFLRALLLLSLSVAACKTPNPQYCDDTRSCFDGNLTFCDLVGRFAGQPNTCIDVYDAGLTCSGRTDCPSLLPVCATTLRCERCTAAVDCWQATEAICRPNGACEGCKDAPDCTAFAGAPICRGDGRCVECLSSATCAIPTSPICDATTGRCRACRADVDCGSLACDDATGSCLAEGAAIYVDAAAPAPGAPCTKAQPCKTITEGFAKLQPGRLFIHVAPGVYSEIIVVVAGGGTLSGAGATLQPPATTSGALLTVDGGTSFTVRGVRFANARGIGGHGVRCNATTLTLRGVIVEGSADYGVLTDACNLTLERSTIRNNPKAGLIVRESTFVITNNFIHGNGSSTTSIGGLSLYNQVAYTPQTFEFNTVVDNLSSGAGPGVYCATPLASRVTVRSSIVYANQGSSPGMPNLYGCDVEYSDIDATPLIAGPGNRNDPPQFVNAAAHDYHLLPTSPCINTGDPNATIGVDFDGDSRPSNGRREMGADEIP